MLDEARSVLGSDALLPSKDLGGWAVAGVTPRAVLRPRSVEEIAAVLLEATHTGARIEPAGGGTWLRHGMRPAEAPVVVSTTRLQQVLEYEPADLVISVEAGAPLGKLQEVVGQNRQMIALDAPSSPGATVGALVALSEAGPLRLGYGTPRDQVLGLQVVTGDGRMVNLGGKVVKNVAGYDLTRLLVGSHGTLGIITQVHLRLRPLPARDVTFTIDGPPAELCDLLPAINAAAFEAAAIELIMHPTNGQAILVIRVQGNVAMIDAAVVELSRVVGRRAQTLPEGDDRTFWRTMADLAVNATFAARLALLPDQAHRVLAFAERFRPMFPRLDIMLHAGSGIARVYADASPTDVDALAAEIARTRDELAAMRGTLIVPMLPAELQGRTQPYAPVNSDMRIMGELKRVFDPAGILAAGRFLR